MSHHDKVMLDKMVELYEHGKENPGGEVVERILLLLECVCEFREPPRSIPVEDGYGAMAVAG